MSGRTHELSDRLTDGHANDEPSMVAPEGAFGALEEKSFKTFECSRGAEFAKEGHLFSLAELVRLSSGRLTELVTPLLSYRRSRADASQPAGALIIESSRGGLLREKYGRAAGCHTNWHICVRAERKLADRIKPLRSAAFFKGFPFQQRQRARKKLIAIFCKHRSRAGQSPQESPSPASLGRRAYSSARRRK